MLGLTVLCIPRDFFYSRYLLRLLVSIPTPIPYPYPYPRYYSASYADSSSYSCYCTSLLVFLLVCSSYDA